MHISYELLMFVHTYMWDRMSIHANMHKCTHTHTPSTIDWHGQYLWHPCVQIWRNDSIFPDLSWEQLRSTIFGWDRSSSLLALCASWIAAKCCSDPSVDPLQIEINCSAGCFTSTLCVHSTLSTRGLLQDSSRLKVWACLKMQCTCEHHWTVQGGWRTPKWIWLSHLSSRLY